MSIAYKSSKALRGTKRVCQSCEVPFYDLSREPIVCPSCGEEYTPVVAPPVEVRPQGAAPGKSSWRSRSFAPLEAKPAVSEGEDGDAPVSVEGDVAEEQSEDAIEDVAETAEVDDHVLEPEADDGD